MWNKLKLIGGVTSLIALMILSACGPQLVDAIDAEEQLAIDVELIEEYLSDKGITNYDTLEGGERIFILEVGGGQDILYNDIISYNYVGRFLNDTIFDTSIARAAFDQDTASANSTIEFISDGEGGFELDVNGLPKLNRVPSYRVGYSPIYSTGDIYQPFVVTHTQGGWAALQQNTINGFKNGLAYALENVKLGGTAVVLIPSYLAYGNSGSGTKIPPRAVLYFELKPIRKR